MATQVQNRRGTTAEHSTFTGAVGELTVDTDKDTVVVHDGSTAGGAPLLREDQSNLPTSAPSNGVYLPSANNVAISTNGTGRLFIGSTGQVGIGKVPTQLFDVEASGNAQMRVTTTDTSGGNLGSFVGRYTGGGGGTASTVALRAGDGYTSVGASTNSPLLFINNETERMRLDTSGRLGLGTSSPENLLTINGGTGVASTGGVLAIRQKGDTTDDGIVITSSFSNSVRLYVDGNGTFHTRSSFTSNNALSLTKEGRVGIGTTSPLGNLHIEAPATSAGWQLRLDSVGLANESGFYRTASDNYEMVLRNAAGGLSYLTNTGGASTSTLEFVVQGSERARIDSSGRLLVGTSSAITTAGSLTALLQVAGTDLFSTGVSAALYQAGTAPAIYQLAKSRNATKGSHTVVQDGDGLGRIVFSGSDGTDFEPAVWIEGQVDGTPGANDMPGRLVFSTTADGAASPTERMRIDSAGTTTLTSAASTAPFIAKINTSEAARIDSAGRLLVGTSSAQGNTLIQTQGQVGDANAEGGMFLRRGLADANIGNGNGLGVINFGGQSGGVGAQIRGVGDAQWASGDYPSRLVFSTTADGESSPTERMRISNNGATNIFLVDTGFAVRTAQTAAAGVAIRVANDATNTTNGTNVFFVRADGDCENTNNSYGAISDIKLKENIVDAGSQWDDLKALQVRKYNFKVETGYNTHTQIGLVAQEVELVSPGLVGESIDEETGESTKSVNYSVLYMKAVKALQEAMERIETLEAKVAALEGV